MKVRELLQTEIWSKETSRKILEPIRKILFCVLPSRKTLKRIGIVLAVLVVVLGITLSVEIRWLTPRERRVAIVSLVQVEELQSLLDCNCEKFGIVDQQAKASVNISEQKAWTVRDHTVAGLLYLYLIEIERTKQGELREAQVKLFIHQRKLQLDSNPKFETEFRRSQLEIFSMYNSELHKEMD